MVVVVVGSARERALTRARVVGAPLCWRRVLGWRRRRRRRRREGRGGGARKRRSPACFVGPMLRARPEAGQYADRDEEKAHRMGTMSTSNDDDEHGHGKANQRTVLPPCLRELLSKAWQTMDQHDTHQACLDAPLSDTYTNLRVHAMHLMVIGWLLFYCKLRRYTVGPFLHQYSHSIGA